MTQSAIRDRFKDALWTSVPKHRVLVGGLGGIGSWLSLFLARTGVCNMILLDRDVVEPVNIGGQFYKYSQQGQNKNWALKDNIDSFTAPSIPLLDLYDNDIETFGPATSVVFAGFDNMAARKCIFEDWVIKVQKMPKDVNEPVLFVDGRLLAERFQVYFVTADRIEEYRDTLFDDSEVETESCTYKSTTHFAAMIAARIVQGYTNYLTNFIQKDDLCDVPHLVVEEGPLYLTEVYDTFKIT